MVNLNGVVNLEGSIDDRIRLAIGVSKDQFMREIAEKDVATTRNVIARTGCNNECAHCLLDETDGFHSMDVLLGTIMKLQAQGHRVNVYAPEAMHADKGLMEAYRMAGATKVLTKGIAFAENRDLVGRLGAMGIRRIDMSLHSVSREPHDLLENRNGSHALALKALGKLSEERKPGNLDYLKVFYVIYKRNVSEVLGFIHLMSTFNVDEVSFLRLLPLGRARFLPDDGTWFLERDDAYKSIEQIAKGRQTYSPSSLRITFFPFWGPNFHSKGIYTFIYNSKRILTSSSRGVCPAGRERGDIILENQGNSAIYPCFEFISFPETAIGIWDREREIFGPGKKKFAFDYRKFNGDCSPDRCEYAEICQGGCRVEPYSIAKYKGRVPDFYDGMTMYLTQLISDMKKTI